MSTTLPLTTQKSVPLRPIPALRIVISVAEACEELWSVQDASQAQQWLRLLHSSLLRDRVDAYDPSEAFLCIQAAAFNFPVTWEHVMWAAAALARACVGPAWRMQRLGELPTQGSTATTLSDSTGESGSPRQHHSPRSFSPLSVDPQQQHPYPYIPEVLPGAILRFAANAPMESRSLAEAQRELVLALCCCIDTIDSQHHRPPEWTILGAHAPVETMVRFWLEAATTFALHTNEQGDETYVPLPPAIQFKLDESVTELMARLARRRLDWWYTLLVARACSDLVSVGWRPHQDNGIVILHLLDVAQQGIALRHIDLKAVHQGAREERLAATSSAAEAISALVSLGSRGLIVPNCLIEVVAQLVQLQLVAGKCSQYTLSLYPLGIPQSADEEHEWQQELEAFLQQRASCFADAADLLGILLANETSAPRVMAALLCDTGKDLQRTAIIVRVVSGALWGKPPNVPGMTALRIYWNEFLILLRELAMYFIEPVLNETDPGVSKESMTLALEVVVAVGRMMECVINRGLDFLASDEWDSFLQMLIAAIIPCLKFDVGIVASLYLPEDERSARKPHKILNRIRSECETVILRLGDYLERCSRFEPNTISNDKCRDGLHFCLLREAAPIISKGSLLAIKVLRSWAAVGFAPGRKRTWVRTASAIVADAFAVYDNMSLSNYGGYLHSPLVRLEALVLLSSDSDPDSFNCELSHSTKDTSQATVSSLRHSITSPMSSTKEVCDEYTELVRASIFPSLSLVFNRAIFEDGIGHVLKVSNSSHTQKVTINNDLRQALSDTNMAVSESEEQENETFKLRKYGIDLLGRLFCSDLGATEFRPHVLKVLTDNCLMEPLRFTAGQIDGNSILGSERITRLITNRSLLCLEAIGQIETCLCAPFFSFPHIHNTLPDVIQALSFVLNHFAGFTCNEKEDLIQTKQQEYAFRLLLFAALLPLARLRRNFDGGLLLVEREEAMSHFPDRIVALFSAKRSNFVDDDGPFVAPFAHADPGDGCRDLSTSTLVLFEPIVAILVHILRTSWDLGAFDKGHSSERSGDLENRFRSSCYDIFTYYSMSGLTFPKLDLVGSLVHCPTSTGSYCATENFTRLRACLAVLQNQIQYTQLALNVASTQSAASMPLTGSDHLIEQVTDLCSSQNPEEVISGCKILIGILPCVRRCLPGGEQRGQPFRRILALLMSSSRDCLEQANASGFCEALVSEHKYSTLDSGPPLLLLIYECALYYMECFGSIESEEAQNLVRLCFNVACSPCMNRSCRTIAVKCAVAVLNRLHIEEIDALIEEYYQHCEDDLSMGGISVASQLEIPESDLILCALAHKSMALHHDYYPLETHDDEQYHFVLASEIENIKTFDTSKACGAAWLCGDHLLTCKLGGENSRHRGWVEVVIRGATFRRRELVRLSSTLSLPNPELPSSLWNENSTDSRRGVTNNYSLESPKMQGDEETLQDALDLLKRFDHLLGIDDDVGINKQRTTSSQPEVVNRSSSPRYPSSDDSFHSGRTNTQEDAFTPVIPSQIELTDPHSILAWLWETLANPAQVEDVTTRLSAMGLGTILDQGYRDESVLVDNPNPYLHPVVRLRMDKKAERDIHLLDRTVALDTHKVALLFATPVDASDDHEDEVDFLLNVPTASSAFFDFCVGLGNVVMSRHLKYFSAGFDTSGSDTDGKFALIWIEGNHEGVSSPSCLTIFHCVPYMPKNVNNRKRHVGNDAVHIVFCDPSSFLHEQLWAGGMQEETDSILIGGEFGFVTIFVIPASLGSYRVKLQLRPGLPEKTRLQLHHLPGEDIISTTDAPTFVRRLANLADIACSAVMHDTLGPQTSWEIRLRQLRLMRRHIVY